MSAAVRHARAEDARDAARLLAQLGYPLEAADWAARLERLVRDGRSAAFVVERAELPERERRVLGLASVHVLDLVHRARPYALLGVLVVDESARGGGLGRLLVEAVEAHARSLGCERLSVSTHERLVGARAFYPRVGLPETGRRFGKDLP